MKISLQFALLSLAARAYCRSVFERDLQTVRNILFQVQSGVDSLDSSVNALNGDPAPVTWAADILTSTIKSGTNTVQASSNLSLRDSLVLFSSVQDLKAHAQRLYDDLNAKRPDIQNAKLCDVTRDKITNIDTASQALIDAIVSKVPSDAQSIARDQASGITKVLDEVQENFAPGNCNNA